MRAYPLQIFRNWRGKYRWRIRADNGNIIDASTQSFWNRADCVRNAELTHAALDNFFKQNPDERS